MLPFFTFFFFFSLGSGFKIYSIVTNTHTCRTTAYTIEGKVRGLTFMALGTGLSLLLLSLGDIHTLERNMTEDSTPPERHANHDNSIEAM